MPRKELNREMKPVKNRIYIWGCGRNARLFIERFMFYAQSPLCSETVRYDDVIAFIDADSSKQGKEFRGKNVISPEEAMADDSSMIIITVADNDGIRLTLRKNNIPDSRWIYWKDYIELIGKELLNNPDVLSKAELHSDDKLATFIRYAIEISDADSKEQKAKIIKRVIDADETDVWTAAFAWFFGCDITGAFKWLEEINGCFKTNSGTPECFRPGMVLDKYYGGGIEKVVALLNNKFVDKNIYPILITEEVSDRDYSLPKDAERYVLGESHDGDEEKRLRQLAECIKKNSINVMCFHVGYARVECFYEVLLSKMMGIPTIMVMHSAVDAIFDKHSDIASSLPYLYRFVDEMVALSSKDLADLEKLGCSCSYVANPVDDMGKSSAKNILKKPEYTVMWAGRIVQLAKQVLDTVDIMSYVCEACDNVNLKIIGGRDNAKVYEDLVDKINNSGLSNRIEICNYTPDLSEFYSNADIMLITSSTESFCNVLAEAKVASLPVVMYELPWLGLIGDGSGIIQVKQRDCKAAADAIITLATDSEMMKKYSRDSWDSIQEFIDHDNASDWINVFMKVFHKDDADETIHC
ncbi:glycosyltransferase [Butyrivibrio fibrisolvens]|uniref:Glycosyl transferase family 1 domain-containing protein n=1 Tax=Butyrivibrio fibrisolvens TaxID=831 RepID=A0A317G9J4_BUTFI|nr:glycosyltransferase [Butyrivibrio fibrisolvens]PWT29262.1 hypothetical protein CPT75_20240 [Butyrivibrio fibrisolvens]